MEVKMIHESDWMEFSHSTAYTIEWTPKKNGRVRVKWNDKGVYAEEQCSDPQYAVIIGEKMLEVIAGGDKGGD